MDFARYRVSGRSAFQICTFDKLKRAGDCQLFSVATNIDVIPGAAGARAGAGYGTEGGARRKYRTRSYTVAQGRPKVALTSLTKYMISIGKTLYLVKKRDRSAMPHPARQGCTRAEAAAVRCWSVIPVDTPTREVHAQCVEMLEHDLRFRSMKKEAASFARGAWRAAYENRERRGRSHRTRRVHSKHRRSPYGATTHRGLCATDSSGGARCTGWPCTDAKTDRISKSHQGDFSTTRALSRPRKVCIIIDVASPGWTQA